ncbi:MAG TPA: peptidase S9 family protein, partial [Alteromonas sp.]|nr:peptidase S9 family protein [Alteromonas sp.]
KHIIYERRSNDIMNDRMHISLWQVEVKSGQHRPLIAEHASVRSPILSPDGSKLAYLSDRSGSQQLYVRYLDSGEDALLTNTSYAPGNVVW